MFWQLADIWATIQDTAILLAKQNQIVMTLQSYATQLSVDEQPLKAIIGAEKPLSDIERLERSASASILEIERPKNVKILDPNTIENADEIYLMVSGQNGQELVM